MFGQQFTNQMPQQMKAPNPVQQAPQANSWQMPKAAQMMPLLNHLQQITTTWQRPQVPVGQQLANQNIGQLDPQTQQLAQIYQQNPMDPRVAHIDPAIFGYAADNTFHPGIQDGQKTIIGNGPRGDNIGVYKEGNIGSIGGKIGQYGGTIGMDNGHLFANMNHNGQPTDPLSALRGLLGL